MKALLGLAPLLVVRGAAQAIDFYVQALGARVIARYEHGSERHISHAELALGDSAFAITEEARAWNSDAPPSLGGSPVVLSLEVSDAGAVLASMVSAGAMTVFPAQELLGERMARVRDPFGHLWLIRERVERLSSAELRRQRDELFSQASARATPPRHESDLSVQASHATSQAEIAPTACRLSSRPPQRLHLVIGPVGAGKSTFALALALEHRAVRLTLDEWMAVLFRKDRPDAGNVEWYVERAARCVDQIGSLAQSIVSAGGSAVLEIGLLRRHERERFYRRLNDAGLECTTYVVDAEREVRRERVEQRNHERGPTFSMVVPPDVFDLASDFWEPPDALECDGRDVRFLRTDRS